MEIKSKDDQIKIFKEYTDKYIENEQDEKVKEKYIDKQNHSLFVLDEAMLTDAVFTDYNDSFKKLLALESLFHDIGRFEQLKVTGTFSDNELKSFYPGLNDHGDLGSNIISDHNLLNELIQDIRIYDEEVMKVIKLHSKVNPNLLNSIMMDYIDAFKNYDLKELFMSKKADKERETLTSTNVAIIQDVDRLDIFRKIVKGIWTPMTTDDPIDPELFELFKQGKLPTINELKEMGRWKHNVGHLIRMSFIDQMNLVPVLKKIRDDNLIEKIYEVNGNKAVEPIYEYTQKNLERIINDSDDIIVKRRK